jgi:hypothetical protein
MPKKTIFELDRILINGGKRGFLGRDRSIRVELIDAKEVEVAI